jgi:hypothetical protein
MRKVLIVGAIILGALAAAAGGFWGGMAYTANREDQARANFTAARGQLAEGSPQPLPQIARDFAFARGDGGIGGGATSGQVKSIEGDVLTLSTAEEVATVNLSAETQIEMTVAGDLADLQVGMRVLVIGEEDSEGGIAASRISILDSNPPGAADPSAPETEP